MLLPAVRQFLASSGSPFNETVSQNTGHGSFSDIIIWKIWKRAQCLLLDSLVLKLSMD